MSWIVFISMWALLGIMCFLVTRRHIKASYSESATNGFFTENQYLIIALIGSVVFSPIAAALCIWDLIDDIKNKNNQS